MNKKFVLGRVYPADNNGRGHNYLDSPTGNRIWLNNDFSHEQNQKFLDELNQLWNMYIQVDRVLTTNWIPVKDNDYVQALDDLIVFNIQMENDPVLKEQPDWEGIEKF
jgi:hypothetical protein